MMVNGIAIMRRRNDSSLNATQILKVAGVDKSKRTKILEREILIGAHEKVQGGYGKYQGTWIPYERGVNLCKQYSVYDLLQPLLEFDTNSPEMENTPTKEQAMAARRKRASSQYQQSIQPLQLPLSSASSPLVSFNHPIQVANSYNTPLSQSATEALSNLGKASRMDTFPLPHSGIFHHGASLPGSAGSINDPNLVQHSMGLPLNGDGSFMSNHPLQQHQAYAATTPVRGMPGLGMGIISNEDVHSAKRARLDNYSGAVTPSKNIQSQVRIPGSNNTIDQDDEEEEDDENFEVNESLIPTSNTPLEPLDTNSTPFFEPSKEVITHIFLDNHTSLIDLFGSESRIRCFALDVPIDDLGHTALHWASALGRIPLVRELIKHGADRLRANYAGESALIRAVLVTNNFDMTTFPRLLDLLYPSIPLIDKQGRSVLHHIALTAGIRGRSDASKYYLSCLLEWIVRKGSKNNDSEGRLSLGQFIKNVVNTQDKNGDTALNIAARVGNRGIAQQLIKVGADTTISNRAGLRPIDFGVQATTATDLPSSSSSSSKPSTSNNDSSADTTAAVSNGNNERTGSSISDTTKVPDVEDNDTEMTDVKPNISSLGSLKIPLVPLPTRDGYNSAVQKAVAESRTAQQQVVNTFRIMLGELQTCFAEELQEKDLLIRDLRSEMEEETTKLNENRSRLDRIKTISREIANYQRRAQNLEHAVLEEDQRFKAEEERQGRPTRGGIDYEGNFDADQPFRIESILSIYERTRKDLLDQKKNKENGEPNGDDKANANDDDNNSNNFFAVNGLSSLKDHDHDKQLEGLQKDKQIPPAKPSPSGPKTNGDSNDNNSNEKINKSRSRSSSTESSLPGIGNPSKREEDEIDFDELRQLVKKKLLQNKENQGVTKSQIPLKSLLRARIRAYKVNEQRLEEFSQELKSRSIDLEQKFRRVVSMCTDVPESRVDGLLEGLVQAVESDPGEVDLSRVAGFLRKVDDSVSDVQQQPSSSSSGGVSITGTTTTGSEKSKIGTSSSKATESTAT